MRRLVLLPLALVLATPVAADDSADDAWSALARFREHLEERSPFSARFEQTYLPEGFSIGETEAGDFKLSLPDCLRWDYDDPYPKSFILCGDVFHYWNPGEPEGHREEIDALEQPGLDLLLLDLEELRGRYEARAVEHAGEAIEIVLRPFEPNEYAVQANLVLDAEAFDLRELSYLDEVGNKTSFVIGDTTSGLEHGTFNPPEDVLWVE